MRVFIFLLSLVIYNTCYAQSAEIDYSRTEALRSYDTCFTLLEELLRNNGSFKKAVSITEDCYKEYQFDLDELNSKIAELKNLCLLLYKSKEKERKGSNDENNYFYNFSIKSIINDTTYLIIDSLFLGHKPFVYNFSDPLGKKDWTNMFVSKLLTTHKGNCRSLTYLYKILADELGVKCWLSLAPNHIYIRNYSRKTGWYNTELTSGTFPTDAWIATTSYVSTDAIRSGIYMDTLSNQQSIALCVLDLAKGYEFQTRNYYDGFILKCCDLVLQYHPVNPMALLLKAETLKKVYLKQTEDKNPDSSVTYAEMEKAYITLTKLHYREMPEKMYQTWLNSLMQQSNKYPTRQY